MEIALNRRGGISVKDQIRFQLELKILAGEIAPGQRLPSVRTLARRLHLHPNTVSAAYRDLEGTGHVELQKGAGVYVGRGAPSRPEDARSLDELVRLALFLAFRQGYSGGEIRQAVERWLAAAPPDRVVVVDPSAEMATLLAEEVRQGVKVPVESCTLEAVQQDPGRLSGALVLTLPYYIEALAGLAPTAAVEAATIEVAEEVRQELRRLPPGAILLLVSHSPTVLPFAEVLLKSLQGDQAVVETRALAASREWRRLLPAADLVLADVLSAPIVSRARPRRMLEVRVLSPASLERLRQALAVAVTPR